MNSQDNTDRKTPTNDVPENSGPKKEKTKEVQLRNVLNKYRSYTYNFTLAALHKSQLSTPEAYRGKPLDFVILKSGGKGPKGMNSSNVAGIQSRLNNNLTVDDNGNSNIVNDVLGGQVLVEEFNKASPGRFDMYIDDIEIDTLTTFTPGTNASLGTNVTFSVIEPYSINGFIEALHVGAVSAGYPSHLSASYVLKMEFVGYPDNVPLPEVQPIDKTTRYFIIKITGIEVEITERGTRYRCTAIPFHEGAFGQPNKLKSDIKMEGKTVKDILKNFAKELNEQIAKDDKSTRSPENAKKHDTYEIKFANIDSTGNVDLSKDTNAIAEVDVKELFKDKTLFKFPDPATTPDVPKSAEDTQKDPDSVKYVPSKSVVQFPAGSNIHECIAAVIRDSEYVKNILRTIGQGKNPDEYGMVDYFIVYPEVENLEDIDPVNKKPYQKYTFIVAPYKIHYTRIPRYNSQRVDSKALSRKVLREYNYIYTGKNVDVINFKLNFNTLFFEAVPKALGNSNYAFSRDGLGRNGALNVESNPENLKNIAQDSNGAPLTMADVPNPSNIGTGGPLSMTPFSVLARDMHEAIVNSKASMLTGELEIIGDPMFLVTTGHGNYKPKSEGGGITIDGEAIYAQSETLISINFRNPIDIGPDGLLQFDKTRVPFSGVYRVNKVRSSFRDGAFKQSLEVMRIPGQTLENEAPSNPADKMTTRDNPLDTPIKDITKAVAPSQRPTGLSFLDELQGLSASATSLLNDVTGLVSRAVSVPGQLISSLNQQASSLITGNISAATNQITALTNGVTADVAKLSSTLGVSAALLKSGSPLVLLQLAALARSIPSNVSPAAASNQGVALKYIPANKIANIPPTAPFTVAPAAEANKTDIADLIKSGGSAALANAYGVSDPTKISASLLSSTDAKDLSSNSSAPTNPLASLGLTSPVDYSLAAGAALVTLNQLSKSSESAQIVAGTLESKQASKSVTTQYGSLAQSPLVKLKQSIET